MNEYWWQVIDKQSNNKGYQTSLLKTKAISLIIDHIISDSITYKCVSINKSKLIGQLEFVKDYDKKNIVHTKNTDLFWTD